MLCSVKEAFYKPSSITNKYYDEQRHLAAKFLNQPEHFEQKIDVRDRNDIQHEKKVDIDNKMIQDIVRDMNIEKKIDKPERSDIDIKLIQDIVRDMNNEKEQQYYRKPHIDDTLIYDILSDIKHKNNDFSHKNICQSTIFHLNTCRICNNYIKSMGGNESMDILNFNSMGNNNFLKIIIYIVLLIVTVKIVLNIIK